MGHSVHAGSGGERLWQGVHQLGIDDGNTWDVIGIYAHHLSLTALIDDDVVDSGLGCSTCCGRQGDDGQRLLLCVGHALKRYNIAELRVGHHYAYALGCIHAGTAANGHDEVSLSLLTSLDAVLYVRNGGVRLHIIENLILDAGLVHNVEHHLGNAKLHETFVGYYKGLLETQS